MKKRKSKRSSGPIYVSPDGGHTVYQQMANGKRKLIHEDNTAIMNRDMAEDQEMWGEDAYRLRAKYPALKKAYDQYKTIYKLVSDQE
jgi:hypothetical protein